MPRRTPLHDEHLRLGARMVEFAGFEMPVQYSGVIEEHLAVRGTAGLFDVSHMGEIEIAGPGAEGLIGRLATGDVTTMTDGRAQYSLLCNERGTIIDDIIIYRFSPVRYVLVVNASNAAKDLAWIESHARGEAKVHDVGDETALIALQGPKSPEILQGLTGITLGAVARYHFVVGEVAGRSGVTVARTGYTGEDGFELFMRPQDAPCIWQAILERGRPMGIRPAGLGARDTLRLEMRYSLYGHEITEETDPIEAGLGWVVKLAGPRDFIGKAAILGIKERGPSRKIAGFRMIGRGIPRAGHAILVRGKTAGAVTSGTMSPSLKVAIGLGYVPAAEAAVGNKISIDIRGEEREAQIVETPFYKGGARS